MSKFCAWLVQEGEGCDYSIGCGNTLIDLKATTWDEAVAELKRAVMGDDGEGGYTGDDSLESALLIEVGREEKMPLTDWQNEQDEKESEEAKRKSEKAERAQLEKLKLKYERIEPTHRQHRQRGPIMGH